MKWRSLNIKETEPAMFGHWWDGEMRENQELRMMIRISGLVGSVGGGVLLQQGQRSSSKCYRKTAMVLFRACARDLTSQKEGIHPDVRWSLKITCLELTSSTLCPSVLISAVCFNKVLKSWSFMASQVKKPFPFLRQISEQFHEVPWVNHHTYIDERCLSI